MFLSSSESAVSASLLQLGRYGFSQNRRKYFVTVVCGGGSGGGGDGDGMVARATGSCNASITLSLDENPVKDD